jgi:hypothetical protein
MCVFSYLGWYIQYEQSSKKRSSINKRINCMLFVVFGKTTKFFFCFKFSQFSQINITATLHYGATQYVIHASAAKAGVDAVELFFCCFIVVLVVFIHQTFVGYSWSCD